MTRNFAAICALALVATASLGLVLRLRLLGVDLPGDFANLRHAHSHAGVYALMFPLVFLAVRALGIATLDARVVGVYLFACLVAVPSFVIGGYSIVSIVASTVVGLGWIHLAWITRRVLRERGSHRVLPLALVAATCFIPPIAIATSRAPEFAQALVHTFLAVLFLLAMAPLFLRHAGVHLDARLYVPSAVLASLHLGVLPSLPTALGLAGVALCIAWSVWRADISLVVRVAWIGFALGGLVLAVSGAHDVVIGGLHYLLLGPLFVTATSRQGASAWIASAWIALGAAALMAGALASRELGAANELVQIGAACAGGLWMLAGLGVLAQSSSTPHATQSTLHPPGG